MVNMPSIFTVYAVQELMGYMSTCPDLKAACGTWLIMRGTPAQKFAADALVAELKDDILTIDQQIDHLKEELAKGQYVEAINNYLEVVLEAKKAGVKHCICPACTLGTKILESKESLYA